MYGMDELIALAIVLGLAVVFGVIAVPFLLVSHLNLKSKVRDLERLVLRNASERAKQPQPVTTSAPTPRTERAAPDAQIAAESPWSPEPPEATAVVAPRPEQPATPAAYVFKPGLIDNITGWLRENWVLAIAAASLALAGVFMVQYGVEKGLLTPFWRVMGALGFGTALIAGGEFIRRRAGDEDGATRYLPSTLSGAGIVVLYAGVFSARALYGLIGPGTTFLGLGGVSVVALVLGWFHGPILAAVGILGATAAPFMVGGSSENSWILHYYFAMIAIVALGIDTIKRWAWVSVLGLIVTIAAGWLLYLDTGAEPHFIAGALIITFAAFTIPERGLIPRQSGPSMLEMLRTRRKSLPEFPARLAFGATLAATAAALAVQAGANTPDTVWLALVALMLLLIATTLWTREAPALYDHALIPGIAFLVALALESAGYGPLFREFQHAGLPVTEGPATSIPMTVWVLAAFGALGTLLMFARMQWALAENEPRPIAPTFWALSATVFAPATLLILEFLWAPGAVLGQYPWALVAITMAALMVWLATRAATATDEGRPLRVGFFAVGALTLITLAFFLVLTKSALTVALAVMVLGTAVLDRRYALPPLTWFIQIAVAIITFRLVMWPGLDWALGYDFNGDAFRIPYFEVAFAFLATLALLAPAWWISRGQRLKTALVLESVCWTILGVFLAITLLRAAPRAAQESHWVMGLMSTIWIALALNQLYRMKAGSRFMIILRAGLAGIYSLIALGTLFELLFSSNPLTAYSEPVVGPPIFDSLALAFLPLAAAFAVAAWKIRHFGRIPRIGFIIASAGFSTLYVGMEIRRLWRGRDLTVPGFTDPELYSYTLAMLFASVALLVFAFGRRSDTLRKIAMAGVALTVAKVFLVDMSGLSGLTRVFSFMGLGLSLVGLAWLNRKMTAQWERSAPSQPQP
jgi:uncharacterized membrane protein